MTTILQEGNLLQPNTRIELFDFDASILKDSEGNGGQIYYLTNSPTINNGPIIWAGNSYYSLPFEITGVDSRGDGSAPNKPQIAISNVNKFFFAAIASLGSLKGIKLTRWTTFYKFTDNGSEPNTLMTYPKNVWLFTREIARTPAVLQYELSTFLDRPNLLLPKKQILRDFGFPGVGRVRAR